MERFKKFITKDKNDGVFPSYVHGKHAEISPKKNDGVVPNYVHGKHALVKKEIKETTEHKDFHGIEGYAEHHKEFDSPEHMDEHLGEHYDKHVAEHPDLHHVKAYTSSSEINGELLAQHKHGGELAPHEQKQVEGLDRILSSKPAEIEHHTYSGLGFDPSRHVNEHGHLHSPAYTSSSPDINIASQFAKPINKNTGNQDFYGEHNPDVVRHVLKIKIPKGSTHGLYVNGSSNYGRHVKANGLNDEKEFLIKRGINYKINPTPTVIKNGQGRVTHHIHHAEIVE